jgi:hypothetical protein
MAKNTCIKCGSTNTQCFCESLPGTRHEFEYSLKCTCGHIEKEIKDGGEDPGNGGIEEITYCPFCGVSDMDHQKK